MKIKESNASMLGWKDRLDRITKSEMVTKVLDREPENKAKTLIRDHIVKNDDSMFFQSMLHGEDERRELDLSNPFGRGSIDDKKPHVIEGFNTCLTIAIAKQINPLNPPYRYGCEVLEIKAKVRAAKNLGLEKFRVLTAQTLNLNDQ